ncbi:T9SS type A sorting domain-containing protein [Terrimonas ferruginea]|uniref:T9SS type A sorting domain-containing protein n=1 Tax=Terrimonas ferruginea TaxID=249 RepID=UPI0009DBB7A1|nr:T9SS type A sorting domain-containing protein [Terrimonas ferruginea]
MKMILTMLLLLMTVLAKAQDPDYPAAPPAPSNIVTAEYFIDTDPGFGNGVPVVTGTGPVIAGIGVSINTSGLTNGIHRLGLRSRNSDGSWSHTLTEEFLVNFDPAYPSPPAAASSIVTAEYFIDTDPGFGNGIPLTTGTGQNLAGITASLNTTGLGNGTHTLGIRSKNNDGSWSHTNIQDFLVDDDFAYPPSPAAPGNITYAEYFFDTDPGFGNGTGIAITPGVDLNNINFAANTSSLADGPHTLFIRSFDDWSITNYVSFLKGSPLPLDFISFSAVASGNDVLLTWQTENEINTSHVDIEWSRNGQDFIKIATEIAANTPGLHQYRYLHLSPGEGRLYYRLKQVDQNSVFKYSNTAVVNMNKAQKALLYPNPASDIITLKNINAADISFIQLLDVHGRQMMLAPVITGLQCDISGLSNGSYLLRVQKKDGTAEVIPFIKLKK